MSVVQPDADVLVLTETGYGKRVPLSEFRRMHRGSQGVRLIALEGRKTGDVAAVQQVTEEDEELMLICDGGQVIRTETNTINRYSSSARGVIVMRLAEGDRRRRHRGLPGGTCGAGRHGRRWRPRNGRRGTDRTPGWRMTANSAFGGREGARLYADQFEIYHGNSNPGLARKICRYLGVEPGRAEVFQFANENIFVKILENVREKDVFLVQPTSHPVNQSIMELLILIDAFKRASAGRITAVIPFYAYGRSDKKDQPRVPITARLIADMITVAGADRVLTMDLHQGQIQGFFNIPVDELTAVHMLSNYWRHKHIEDPVVVTDLGFAKRARTFAEFLDAPLAIIEKRRVGNLDRAELMNVIGDVRGKRAIIVDDEIDTAGTLVEIVRALEREGVTEIYACATHGVLSDPAVDRLAASSLREIVLTDSVPLPERKRLPKITTLSVAPLIGEAIKRIHRGESVGALFSSEVSLTQEMLLWEDGAEGTIDTRRDDEEAGDSEPPPGALAASSRAEPTDDPQAPPTRRRGRPRAGARRRTRTGAASCARRAGAVARSRAGCRTSRTRR